VKRPDRAALTAVVALAALAVFVWRFRILGPAHTPYGAFANGDFYTQIHPMSYRAAAWMRHGKLPLWNPYQACGLPFAATGIYGIFYPLNFPYLVLPTEWAIEAVTVLHLWLAGLAMFAYCRTIGLGVQASAFGGAVYMLSGYVTFQACWFPPALAACVWLPVALVGIERTIERPSMRHALVVSVALAMALLCGWPQLALYGGYVAAFLTIVRLSMSIREHRRERLRALLFLCGGAALGIGLAAIQLFPQIELMRLGPRRAGALSTLQSVSWAMMDARTLVSQAIDASPGVPRLAYLGLGFFVFAPASLGAPFRKAALPYWFLALAGVACAVSFGTPLFELVKRLPGVLWFRALPRILFV